LDERCPLLDEGSIMTEIKSPYKASLRLLKNEKDSQKRRFFPVAVKK